jgi:lipopolysaccharide/colanic/teichoic acid biosynthesis glycosyltransferase
MHPKRSEMRQGIPRSIEVMVALIGLLATAPLMALAAIVHKLTSPGSVFFRQPRTGKDGEPFVLLKLRTMRPCSSGPEVTAAADARVTVLGGILRKTKIDELPQLWNVLKGDMSLVGPRPEVPRYVDLSDPRWRAVLRTRPGLTDPVTLRLRNEEQLLAEVEGNVEQFYVNTLLPIKLRGYLDYISNRSWRVDLLVIIRTILSIVWPGGSPPPSLNQLHSEATNISIRTSSSRG